MKRTTYYNALPIVPPVQDQWPIKKALTLSDVDITHPFLTLSRQQVDSHIVLHMTQQQQDHLRAVGHVDFNARDDDTGETYVMKLKWRGSYYNLIGKWGKVIRGKGLDVGQDIYIRWSNGCLHFSVPQQQVVTMPPLRMLALPTPPAQDQWPIKKVLTLSDVDLNHPFLPLPRRLVEDHILLNWTQEQRELLRREEQERYIATASGQDSWPIKKALTSSDVDINHPFLTLPGKAVEDHILFYWTLQAREQLRNEHQINVNARDEDTGDLYLMKLRWRGSYYNLIGKWGKIVRGKKLHVGREIRLRWENGCLLFSVP